MSDELPANGGGTLDRPPSPRVIGVAGAAAARAAARAVARVVALAATVACGVLGGCAESPSNVPPVVRSAPSASPGGSGAASASAAAASSEGFWPQWRGPNHDGVSTESGWLAEGKTEPLWFANVGVGQSSVAVADGRLYTKGFREDLEMDEVQCLDALTGKEIWAASYPARIRDSGHRGGTLSTPSVDGEDVYTLDREGRFMRFAAADGTVVWRKLVTDEHGVDPPTWGFAASPLVLDDMIVLNVGKVIAYDKTTGEPRWETRNYKSGYSTPVEFDLDGRPTIAVNTGSGLAVVDRGDGAEIDVQPWRTSYQVNASTPVVVGDRLFISTAYQRGCAMVEYDANGARIAWESKVMRNKMSGCVLFDGHLYGFDESILKCIDVDGNEQWRERGLGMGALMIAGDRLVVLGEDGELIIAGATPAGFEELSRVQALDGGICWSTPVLAGGLIYCRNSEGDLVCMDHRPAAATP